MFMLRCKNHPQNLVPVLWCLETLKMEKGTTACLSILALQSCSPKEGKSDMPWLDFQRNETSLIQNLRPRFREA